MTWSYNILLKAFLAAFLTAVCTITLAQGKRVVIIGDSITDGNWGCVGRGFSGHKLSDLAARWQEDVLDLHPDVLSVLIGTNDVGAYYRNKSDKPFDFEARMQATRRLAGIVRELCREFDAVCVPFDTMFEKLVRTEPEPSFWIWDGVHPTAAGHRRMADLWEKKVRL